MLCATPSSSSSSCVSTDDVSCVSTNDVSDVSTDDISDVSTDDVSCVSTTDDVSSSCISVENAMLFNPLSCSPCVSHKDAILGTGRILAKPCRTRWKLLSGKF